MTSLIAFAVLVAALQAPVRREVAVTFDDLPLVSSEPLSLAARDSLTVRLLGALAHHQVPAIGFVNESGLMDASGHLDSAMVHLLERWLDGGFELGNHTYSHPNLHQTSLVAYEEDILRGEAVTRRLLGARGKTPRYFRHPYLHTGRTLAVRDSLVAFLAAHGYRVAPVTIDNSDYVFARAFDRAHARGDTVAATRVAANYLKYMDAVIAFYERQSVAIVGREIPQVLLLHASPLNAVAFDRLATRLEGRGYTMVSLDRALADSAYQSADRYTGPSGITWLHRWAITRGMPGSVFRGEPEVPDWVSKAAQ
jgi:peptidoglycan/xylan/chitin deacetylase (PgdA/CDA1 family)